MTGPGEAFDERGFWARLRRVGARAGREVVEKALWLYYAAQAPATPAWARSVIYGALAYLVLPADAIPDALPAVGFSDDLGVLAAAVTTVTLFIDAEVRRKATATLERWFGRTAKPAGLLTEAPEIGSRGYL